MFYYKPSLHFHFVLMRSHFQEKIVFCRPSFRKYKQYLVPILRSKDHYKPLSFIQPNLTQQKHKFEKYKSGCIRKSTGPLDKSAY